jgi:hypothetical protein
LNFREIYKRWLNFIFQISKSLKKRFQSIPNNNCVISRLRLDWSLSSKCLIVSYAKSENLEKFLFENNICLEFMLKYFR